MVSLPMSISTILHAAEGEVEWQVEERQEEVDVEHPCSKSECPSISLVKVNCY